MSDHFDRDENAEPRLANEPRLKIDPNEAIEPIENAEPVDPIDRNDPFDPIDRNESFDHSDRLSDMLRFSHEPRQIHRDGLLHSNGARCLTARPPRWFAFAMRAWRTC